MQHLSKLQQLSETNRRVADAEWAVMKQIADVDRQRGNRPGLDSAERTLRAFVHALEELRRRRELIAQTIERSDDSFIQGF
jgi:predicted  nucleic acid-binding Zn-ribbon protein